MIILDKNSELLVCSCGTKFIADSKDIARRYADGKYCYRAYICPYCNTVLMTINLLEDGSEIIEIEKEKEDEKTNNE